MMRSPLGTAAMALGLAIRAGYTQADIGPNSQLDADGIALANVSISVSDLDRSTKFYQGLGFEIGDRHEIPAGWPRRSVPRRPTGNSISGF